MSGYTTFEYEVTHDGRVFSVDSNWRGYGKREMSQTLNAYGYPCVRVVVNGKRKRLTVHSLVVRTHIGPQPAPGHEIRHLDGNKLNNHYQNLAWGTAKQNAEDRERHGRTSRGERHAASIRASTQASAIRDYSLHLSDSDRFARSERMKAMRRTQIAATGQTRIQGERDA